ncbi:3-mercaptopyruvate sulfurtransferase [Methylomagnum sp.]
MHTEPTSPLISAESLASRLDDPDIAVLDATFFLPNQGRDATREYLDAHLPGARFFDIDAIADHASPLPHMLPSESLFAESVGKLGIGNHTLIVVYDNNSFMASARAWWTFRVFGHERVMVLDGGLARWKDLGLPLESGPVASTPREFSATLHPGLVRGLDEVKTLLNDDSVQILDARSPGRFAGTEPEPRQGLRSGHIPNSKNLFFKRLVDDQTHCLKPVAELESEFHHAGIDLRRQVVATCGTGVTASVLALGLYCLGNEYAAVYDGSWTEWGGRADTPVSAG